MRIDRLLILCVLLPLTANSQVAQSSRFEIPIGDPYSKPYANTSLGDDGLLVYGTVIADGIEAIEVIRLDTALAEVWKGYIKLERRSVILMAQSIKGRAILLLKDRFTKSGLYAGGDLY